MNAPRQIPDSVRARQIAASDPDVSAWVAANAGSGKTHVLAQRVIRLLLKGVPPARILCITFTKAAAANMANRVFEALAQWTALDDDALDEEMKQIGVREIDADLRARARQLFALALETPGGLKVQTIHAFCTHLLHVFPFEAKVAARFTVLDEAAEAQLIEQISLAVLLEAAGKPDGALGRALTAAIAVAADRTLRDMLDEAIGERDKLTAWIEHAGGIEAAVAQLSTTLGIAPDDTLDRIDAEMINGSHLPMADWAAAAEQCDEGSSNDRDQCARLKEAITEAGEARIEAYLSIFFTGTGEPRKNIITAPLAKKYPDLARRLGAEQARVTALRERRRIIAARDRTAALITIAATVVDRYRKEKERRALLDYDDLIDKALDLLTSTPPAWVHYKLDRGIDHVLIDEAQDTSSKQWAIIRALVAEFFAGAGAHVLPRTIFAVGDEKQSIFSFQGAAPREFEAMRREFDRLSKAVRRDLQLVHFEHSFRSGANVLGAVDTVFKSNDIYLSIVSEEEGYLAHEALPDAAPGLVEIWPLEKPDDKREIEGWDAPFDEMTPASPIGRLAQRIARTVQHWRRRGTRPGEVLILVRRRGPLFEAIIGALKRADIPVAGADRLVLTEHIAVMDLLALTDALLLPGDDLALATVLKSPLFGLNEDQLFQLAWNREGTLRAALRAKSDPALVEVSARLDRMTEDARNLSPFGFYARLLNAECGRKRILARLGHEATDALDEFLNLALEYERNETPSLQGFVAWVRAARATVKRDMEIARDEVRVMTVHGAKGLEARNVILADTTTPPEGWHPPRLLALPAQPAAPGTPDRLIWVGPRNADAGPMADARAAALEAVTDEYRRLLYVAMTRAAERLVVCGVEGERKPPEGCWYNLVRDALESDAKDEPADDGEGIVWRFRKAEAKPASEDEAAREERKPIALPDWLQRDARADVLRELVIPSHAGNGVGFATTGDREARRKAIERGNLVHRLMQSLPNIAPAQRAEAARRFLSKPGRKLREAERAEITRQVMAVLDIPNFAPLFSPGSRAELPIVGQVDGKMVAGQVDRLAVTPEAVLIADYKTNSRIPRTIREAQEIYPGYIRQLALYREVLRRLYPGRPVRAALVWTEGPILMEIPEESLDSALAKNTSS
jgi:ATP-dependent helicase/nuclease subunit A